MIYRLLVLEGEQLKPNPLEIEMVGGKDKVYTLVRGNINMTCRLTSKSATTIAPVSIYYVAEPSTTSKFK